MIPCVASPMRSTVSNKQGRKRPLDTPKRREREGERERLKGYRERE